MVLQGRTLNRLEALKVVLDDFISQREGIAWACYCLVHNPTSRRR